MYQKSHDMVTFTEMHDVFHLLIVAIIERTMSTDSATSNSIPASHKHPRCSVTYRKRIENIVLILCFLVFFIDELKQLLHDVLAESKELDKHGT